MGSLMLTVVTYIRAFFVPRHKLALEAAALQQQLAVFKRKQPRPRLSRADRLSGPRYGDCIRGGVLASRWLPSVLAVEVSPTWAAPDDSRDPRTDPAYEGPRIRHGARRASTANCSNSGSTCPNRRFLATCKV